MVTSPPKLLQWGLFSWWERNPGLRDYLPAGRRWGHVDIHVHDLFGPVLPLTDLQQATMDLDTAGLNDPVHQAVAEWAAGVLSLAFHRAISSWQGLRSGNT